MCHSKNQACHRCSAGPVRRYLLALSHDEGMKQGEHVADVEVLLCDACCDVVADWLIDAIGSLGMDAAVSDVGLALLGLRA